MISYRDLYNSISNPIENPELFDVLIEQYSNNQPIYNILTSVYRKEKRKTNVNQTHKDNISVVLFDYWSDSIQEQSESILPLLKKTPLYSNMTQQEFRELQGTLKTIGKISSFQQLKETLEKYPIVKKYMPNSNTIENSNMSTWTHIVSEQYDRFDGKKENIEHRLYLNIENENLYAVIYFLIKKITDKNLPYHFKYSEGLRDDSIVIYTDKEHLKEYIDILREIKKEHSNLFSDYLKPPILTGKIDGWIGYGTEPGDEKKSSFNAKRAEIIENSIDETFFSYLTNNNINVKVNNNEVSPQEYCAYLLTKKLFEDYKESYSRAKTQDAINKVYERIGFLPTDLNSNTLNRIYEEIKSQIPEIIRAYKEKKDEEVSLKITTRKGKQSAPFINYKIKKIIKSFSKQIYKTDKSFIKSVIQKIIIESKKAGIDVKKFCFDIGRRDELLAQDDRKRTASTGNNLYQTLRGQINNPLDNNETIKKIIKAHSKAGVLDEENFYASVASLGVENKNKENALQADRDALFAYMFSIWKDQILRLDYRQISEIIKKEKHVDEDFRQLQAYVRSLPPIKTEKQYKELVYKSNNDLLKKYGWDHFEDSWMHIKSRLLTGKKEEEINIKHRLYINNDKKYTYTIAVLFTEKCRQRNIPFYYKYNEGKDRDDTIVIYSDTEHLTDYISILKEMKKEHPQLMANTHEPPLLTGNIDGWIGYGADPNGRVSYTTKRTNSLFKALEGSIVEWVNNKEKVAIGSNNNRRLVERKDIFTRHIIKYLIEEKKNKIDNRMMNQLYVEIYNNIDNIIDCFKNKKQLYSLHINNTNGNISINYYVVRKLFRTFSQVVAENDSNYINLVRNNISKQLLQDGIDPSMICFDEEAKIELENHTQAKRSEQLRSMLSSTATLGETRKLYTA